MLLLYFDKLKKTKKYHTDVSSRVSSSRATALVAILHGLMRVYAHCQGYQGQREKERESDRASNRARSTARATQEGERGRSELASASTVIDVDVGVAYRCVHRYIVAHSKQMNKQ